MLKNNLGSKKDISIARDKDYVCLEFLSLTWEFKIRFFLGWRGYKMLFFERTSSDDIGIWTTDELRQYRLGTPDKYGYPHGRRYFTISAPDAERIYTENICPALLSYCTYFFSIGMVQYGLIKEHARNAIIIVATEMNKSHP
jgi:hypothetical protein